MRRLSARECRRRVSGRASDVMRARQNAHGYRRARAPRHPSPPHVQAVRTEPADRSLPDNFRPFPRGAKSRGGPIAATPLSEFWLKDISALSPSLVVLARHGLWLGCLLPGLNTLQSWYQGVLLNSGKTRGISDAVGVFVLATGAVLVFGVVWGQMTGLYIGLVAFSVGMIFQTIWLYMRSRKPMALLNERDAAFQV